MNFNMGSLMPTGVALALVRGAIEGHVKHSVKDFQMHIYMHEQKIDFKVFVPENETLPPAYDPETRSRLYKFDDAKQLMKTVKMLIQKEVKTEDVIDYAIVNYSMDGKQKSVDIYYKKDGVTPLTASIEL
jgi:hypothetical protein